MRRAGRVRALLDGAARTRVAAELAALRGGLPDCRTVLLCSVDGLVIASDSGVAEVDPAVLAAAATDLAAQGRRTSPAVGVGDAVETVTRGAGGWIAVYPAGPFAVLAIVAGPGGNLALSSLGARRAAARLTEAVRLPDARR